MKCSDCDSPARAKIQRRGGRRTTERRDATARSRAVIRGGRFGGGTHTRETRRVGGLCKTGKGTQTERSRTSWTAATGKRRRMPEIKRRDGPILWREITRSERFAVAAATGHAHARDSAMVATKPKKGRERCGRRVNGGDGARTHRRLDDARTKYATVRFSGAKWRETNDSRGGGRDGARESQCTTRIKRLWSCARKRLPLIPKKKTENVRRPCHGECVIRRAVAERQRRSIKARPIITLHDDNHGLGFSSQSSAFQSQF